MLYFEQNAPGANITTGGDALWWAFVSITTVGYGDKFPITPGGRLSAFFVLAAGVGLFGVLSGYLANFFLTPSSADEPEDRCSRRRARRRPVARRTSVPAGAPRPRRSVLVPPTDEREETLRTLAELDASIEELRRRLTVPPSS